MQKLEERMHQKLEEEKATMRQEIVSWQRQHLSPGVQIDPALWFQGANPFLQSTPILLFLSKNKSDLKSLNHL